MQSMTQTAQTRKPPRAYFAHLDDRAGILTQVDGTIYFLDDVTDALTVITPEHVNFLVALGEVGLAEAAHTVDMVRGGYARIACTRAMEVA